MTQLYTDDKITIQRTTLQRHNQTQIICHMEVLKELKLLILDKFCEH